MVSSTILSFGHRHYASDVSSDDGMGRRTKQRNSGINDHPTSTNTSTGFGFPPSISPLPVSSPSLSGSSQVVIPLPKRISITNVVRPIPKRISTQYYDEAHQKGLTLNETNQAAMMAHDWHRKWTHQDEENHTMPEADFYRSTTVGIPVSYAYGVGDDVDVDTDVDTDQHQSESDMLMVLEREEGAKNPSLGSSPEDASSLRSSDLRTHKRDHSATSSNNRKEQQHANNHSTQFQFQDFSASNSDCKYRRSFLVSSTEASTALESSSDEDPRSCHQVKRQFTGFDNAIIVPIDDNGDDQYESYHEDDSDEEEEPRYNNATSVIQRPIAIRPVVVKPVAVHANRSDFVLPHPPTNLSPFAHGGRHGKIPRDIVTNQFRGEEIVSPMTSSHLAGSSSTISPPSSIGNDMVGMTVLKTDQGALHLVENDCKLEPNTKENDMDSITTISNTIEKERDDVLHTLAIGDGDVESGDFLAKVDPLEKYFLGKEVDTRSDTSVANSTEGMWLTLSKPNWFGKLGENDNGDPMYTLGRMSFDMFSPTNLVCSIQGNFNRVEVVNGKNRKAMLDVVPKKLREEVESGKTILRTYHIVTAFTIEPSMADFPNAPNRDVIRPIRGIMTTYGYSLPDPDTPNRHSIWFTGGRIEPNDDVSDIRLWKAFFTLHPPKHSFGEKAKLLAVKLLMGATIPDAIDPEDGSMNYVFTRPLGGHGMAYVDVVYIDESLRIVRGQRGTTFVFSRVSNV